MDIGKSFGLPLTTTISNPVLNEIKPRSFIICRKCPHACKPKGNPYVINHIQPSCSTAILLQQRFHHLIGVFSGQSLHQSRLLDSMDPLLNLTVYLFMLRILTSVGIRFQKSIMVITLPPIKNLIHLMIAFIRSHLRMCREKMHLTNHLDESRIIANTGYAPFRRITFPQREEVVIPNLLDT